MHDPCVIGYLLKPELFETASATVQMELSSPDKLGQLICQCDRKKKCTNDPNC
ncbi:MAG: hypothetical protein HC852_09375 [Acaryochloridaceae cyanobacterium RU_4_10]|nr:hypothetical protein [Acaryochloridaceae cyanobacterium RU_4_10]